MLALVGIHMPHPIASIRSTLVLFLLLVLAPAGLRGQLTEASLKGIALDPSGQVIAGCSVVARHDATGQTRTAITDETGGFLMAGLPPGVYTLER